MFLLFQYFEEIVPFGYLLLRPSQSFSVLWHFPLQLQEMQTCSFTSSIPTFQGLKQAFLTFSSRTYCICCSQFVFYTEETKRRTCICSAKYLHSVCTGNWASSFLLLQSSIQFWSLTSASWTVILKRNISLINRTSSSILASWILLNNIKFSNLPCSFILTIRTDLFYQLFTRLWLFFPPVFA